MNDMIKLMFEDGSSTFLINYVRPIHLHEELEHYHKQYMVVRVKHRIDDGIIEIYLNQMN